MKNQKGFSLIELLIVVVIIGILAAVAIPNYLAARRSTNEAATVSALRTIHGADHSYKATIGGGKFAVSLAELNSKQLIDSTLSGATSGATAKSGYFYTYAGSAAGSDPSVFSVVSEPYVTSGQLATGSRQFLISEVGVLYTTINATTTPTIDAARNVSNALPLSN